MRTAMGEDELKRSWRAWLKDGYTPEEADQFFNEFMRHTKEAAWDEGWVTGWGRPPLAPTKGNPYRIS